MYIYTHHIHHTYITYIYGGFCFVGGQKDCLVARCGGRWSNPGCGGRLGQWAVGAWQRFFTVVGGRAVVGLWPGRYIFVARWLQLRSEILLARSGCLRADPGHDR